MNENISILTSKKPREKFPLLINILKEYGLNQKKKIYLQSFELYQSYYVNHLIALISGADFLLVESYMFPTGAKSRDLKKRRINGLKFVSAIEKIRDTNICISDSKIFENESWLDYVFDLSSTKAYQVIIIDNFEEFIRKTNENINVIKSKINKYCQKYKAEIILFMDDKDILKYDFSDWKISSIDSPFHFVFNNKNYKLLSVEERMV